MQDAFENEVFYRSVKQYIAALSPSFDLVAQEEASWMRYRIRRHRTMKRLSPLIASAALDPALRFAGRRLAGCVLVLRKRKPEFSQVQSPARR